MINNINPNFMIMINGSLGDLMNKDDLLWIDYTVKDADTGVMLEEKKSQLISIEKSTFPNGVKAQLLSSNVGDTVEVVVDKPYGDRDASKIRIVPLRTFHNSKIQPYPGLPVTLDGVFAVVKSVSGGRVIVDFNHPFAGRTVKYILKITGLVTKPLEKIRAIANVFKIDEKDIKIEKKKEDVYEVVIDKGKYNKILDSFKANIAYFIPGIKVNVIEK